MDGWYRRVIRQSRLQSHDDQSIDDQSLNDQSHLQSLDDRSRLQSLDDQSRLQSLDDQSGLQSLDVHSRGEHGEDQGCDSEEDTEQTICGDITRNQMSTEGEII